MEAFTSEIRIEGNRPWTPRQRVGARAAMRAFLEDYLRRPPTESEIDESLAKALDSARRYCPECRGASLCFVYYPVREGYPEDYDALAAKMQAACEGMGLRVTTLHYR